MTDPLNAIDPTGEILQIKKENINLECWLQIKPIS